MADTFLDVGAAAGPVAADSAPPLLPGPRGPMSEFVIEALRRPVGELERVPSPEGPWDSDDLQLALYICYELHYQSFAGVDERWEWEPSLLALRRKLEARFEGGLHELVRPKRVADVTTELLRMVGSPAKRSLSSFMEHQGTLTQLREFLVHRSAYQLKEADPHTWAVPRLRGDVKAAMVHIQADEYGNGIEAEMHSVLFARTLGAVGLDARYGAYLDWLPAPTLATVNLVSLFGLHRRWRAALVGHLALFEMTSVGPMARYAAALRRVGVDHAGCRFYDVHVEVDAEHELIAANRLAAGLAAAEPQLAQDILFGAGAVMELERRFSDHLLDSWSAMRTSLRLPLPG